MGLLLELIAVVLAVFSVRLIDVVHPFGGDARIGEVVFLWIVWNYILGQVGARYAVRRA